MNRHDNAHSMADHDDHDFMKTKMTMPVHRRSHASGLVEGQPCRAIATRSLTFETFFADWQTVLVKQDHAIFAWIKILSLYLHIGPKTIAGSCAYMTWYRYSFTTIWLMGQWIKNTACGVSSGVNRHYSLRVTDQRSSSEASCCG